MVDSASGGTPVEVDEEDFEEAVAVLAQAVRPASRPQDAARRLWQVEPRSGSYLHDPRGRKDWHHIVEQTPGNVQRFGPQALHNTENVIPLDKRLHTDVSGLYSSIRRAITQSNLQTVRQWLSTQSYEAQREFGLIAIENVRKGVW
ncbi:hypothetical protein [Corallococcus sp. AS-1-12]|uniref:hypothetical protein n=1 Tax=Corallococcus sp. AS-1-12 TaxID=2874598 RepID=UPI00351D3B1A